MNKKKELKEAYKARKVVGGVYRFVNRENDRFWLQSTDDMAGTRNFFKFCQLTGNCTIPPLQEDWKTFGKESFALEELELLEKGETQTDGEYRQDLAVLLELWEEKLPAEGRYK